MFFCLNAFSQTSTTTRTYQVWDNVPAQNRGSDSTISKARGYPYDEDWEQESYPIGNGYMGANIFGRTDTERIQITEKTLANEGLYGIGGLTSFAEILLDINHTSVTNYTRSLNLNNAILNVSYDYDNVTYTREYLANYPDNVIAVKLSASKKKKISFTLRAETPYLRRTNEINTRTGNVVATKDLITLSGNIAHFNVNYEGQVKVINDGGKLTAINTDGKGAIKVTNANSVVILIATGTNYKLSDKIFLEDSTNKKLDENLYPHDKVSRIISEASSKGYSTIKENHINDFNGLFSRVNLILSPRVPQITTRALVEAYTSNASSTYLEELMFHFGRYLLISSSRKGTLPTGLQGVWSQYEVTPWTGGYWHNINVQMNYWGALNTNLAETFTPYLEYFEAYYPKANTLATQYLTKNNPDALSENPEDNGWTIGTGASAYIIVAPGGHSGPGTGGFTSKLFWDYYEFTQDTAYLAEIGYPALLGMSQFLAKTVKPAADGLLLVEPSASPEQKHNGESYITKGATFDQGFVWEAHHDLLVAAQVIGANDVFLNTAKDQINKLDPIIIGASGQIKEFREENEYGEIGDKHHRHLSHLCALYPGTLINTSHPEWMQGVSTVLDFRGNETTGWAMAHRMNLRARTKEAEEAHKVYSKFLKERTLPNLWTVHPPFQIDGNLGTMAGVAEMLIQSHEGFIELLPALPKAWETGVFSGLVARGNFELSLNWTNNTITSAKVISKNGGECRIKCKYIEKAQITDATGQTIPHTMTSENIIVFKTNKLGQYNIAF